QTRVEPAPPWHPRQLRVTKAKPHALEREQRLEDCLFGRKEHRQPAGTGLHLRPLHFRWPTYQPSRPRGRTSRELLDVYAEPGVIGRAANEADRHVPGVRDGADDTLRPDRFAGRSAPNRHSGYPKLGQRVVGRRPAKREVEPPAIDCAGPQKRCFVRMEPRLIRVGRASNAYSNRAGQSASDVLCSEPLRSCRAPASLAAAARSSPPWL